MPAKPRRKTLPIGPGQVVEIPVLGIYLGRVDGDEDTARFAVRLIDEAGQASELIIRRDVSWFSADPHGVAG